MNFFILIFYFRGWANANGRWTKEVLIERVLYGRLNLLCIFLCVFFLGGSISVCFVLSTVRTLMPCIRDMARNGLNARSVRMVLNAWMPPAPQSEATKLINDTYIWGNIQRIQKKKIKWLRMAKWFWYIHRSIEERKKNIWIKKKLINLHTDNARRPSSFSIFFSSLKKKFSSKWMAIFTFYWINCSSERCIYWRYPTYVVWTLTHFL